MILKFKELKISLPCCFKTVMHIKANGKMVKEMAEELNFGMMDLFTKDIGKII